MPTIQARGLTKRFGSNVLAVDHLDFDATPGAVTGFLGPNGAGKTTTLRMLLGLVRPTSGSVLIDGQEYRNLRNPTLTIGAVLEASGFHPARSARQHLRVIAAMAGIPFRRVDECLELVGLTDAAGRRVGAFSLGMRQRLELARALLGRPEVLVLDEPANGLDPQGIVWLREFLRWYASGADLSERAGAGGSLGGASAKVDGGRVIIVSSHLLSEAQQTVDDVVVLVGGRLAAQGNVQQLLAGQRSTVEVRTPDAQRLVQALVSHQRSAALRDGRVVCDDITPAELGRLMLEERIEVHEMTSTTESLESLFFQLTSGEGAHPGHAAGVMGGPVT